ncbi:SDR family oxidoreductase [Protaetiibacter sp. SSC-01]|uniref:SDR family oxidoreductase n=1 Tax=Protaetiibacter sp. SSC-01 TaxID=2759943 RepID=UPI001656F42F|nr:SDR family oxidoreductase [Protaetiibacter sp. SSC-01]QNO38112.1 SDR family oxidoreductase [Protaetiibacter sp. SSC-01]
MKIVVIGGTGLIGRQVIERLTEHGHNAVAAAPSTGVDTIAGTGLSEAFAGADVVVDVSNSPDFSDDAVMDFFRTSTTNVLAAEKEAGVGHHVALSIVGIERMLEAGYFRAKQAQERLIRSSGVPYSIVHATQFFEFARGIGDSATDGDIVRLPSAPVQPMASSEVAAAVAKTAAAAPLDGDREIGGPERFGLDEFVRRALRFFGDPREVVADEEAGYFGGHPGPDTLVPGPGADLGTIRFAEWLEAQR